MANGLLGNLQPNGLLGPVTMNPNIAKQGRNALASALRGSPRNALLDPEFYMRDLKNSAVDYFSDPENSLRALSIAPVPVLSDVAGLAADALMYKNKPESRNMLNFGLTGVGMLPFIPALATAYHGSPYKFDKFDASHIGKGEGAQAYGHGIYFAETPKVAESYKTANATLSGTPEGNAAGLVGIYQGDTNKALQYLQTILPKAGEKTFSGETREFIASSIDALKSGKYKDYPQGSLYKVDIPDEYIPRMLDWDKPLSQQTPEVQKALAKAVAKRPDMTGAELYNVFGGSGKLDQTLNNGFSFGQQASDTLRELGITGIRYLDGGSRGTGQGTSNYVVFPGNEGAVKILERK